MMAELRLRGWLLALAWVALVVLLWLLVALAVSGCRSVPVIDPQTGQPTGRQQVVIDERIAARLDQAAATIEAAAPAAGSAVSVAWPATAGVAGLATGLLVAVATAWRRWRQEASGPRRPRS